MKKALIVVDTQNDFCPGGGFPVPDGDKIIKPLNKVLSFARRNNWKMFASRDWHSPDLFSENDCDKHCIQNTKGAKFHPGLNIKNDVTIISKGANDHGEEHWSAFNGDELSLDKLLRKSGVEEIYIGGLALDYCVKTTALEAIKKGYRTFIMLDATKAINNKPESIKKLRREMEKQGIQFIRTSDIIKLDV